MNRIIITIATRNRLAKLQRLIRSTPKSASGYPVEFLIGCDGDRKTFEYLLKEKIPAIYSDAHVGSIAVRNLLTPMIHDAWMIYLVDDVEIDPHSIDAATIDMTNVFPDGDGLIGFTQRGNPGPFCPAGVGMVGDKFIDRFPERKLFYPSYYHFAAGELYDYAVKTNRFFLSKGATIFHHHPGAWRKEIDITHREARMKSIQDKELRRLRQAAGLIWGIHP